MFCFGKYNLFALICCFFFYASFLRADLLKLQIESSRAERLPPASSSSCDCDSVTFDIEDDAAGAKLLLILPGIRGDVFVFAWWKAKEVKTL